MGLATAPVSNNAGWSRSTPLLAGDAGTAQTIDLIRQAVWSGLQDARVRAQLARILNGIPAYDTTAEIQAIFNWVLANIRFTNDPIGHETISTASWTIEHRIGDCDDINAVLIPTLVMMAGIPARLVTVSNDPSDPARFSHIYAEAEVNGGWIALDAARPGARFGATVAQYGRKRLWSLVDRKYQDLAGLSGVSASAAGMAGWDMDIFGGVISDISKGIADIVGAFRRPTPISPGGGGQPPPPGPYPYPAPSTGISTNTLLILGGLGIGAMLLMKK